MWSICLCADVLLCPLWAQSRDSHTEGRHTNENHYVNGPKVPEDVDHMEEPCESDTGKNAKSWGDYRQMGELTPANLISFGWQIASGMVSAWMSN